MSALKISTLQFYLRLLSFILMGIQETLFQDVLSLPLKKKPLVRISSAHFFVLLLLPNCVLIICSNCLDLLLFLCLLQDSMCMYVSLSVCVLLDKAFDEWTFVNTALLHRIRSLIWHVLYMQDEPPSRFFLRWLCWFSIFRRKKGTPYWQAMNEKLPLIKPCLFLCTSCCVHHCGKIAFYDDDDDDDEKHRIQCSSARALNVKRVWVLCVSAATAMVATIVNLFDASKRHGIYFDTRRAVYVFWGQCFQIPLLTSFSREKKNKN